MQRAKFQHLWSEAVTHLQAGRLVPAARLCTQLRAAAPRDFGVLHLSGLISLQDGRAQEAAEALVAARQINRQSASTAMCLGLAWSAMGRQDDAEAALRDAIRLAPESAETWGNLGAVLAVLNRFDEAIACYRRAIELKPAAAVGWVGLGSTLLLAGRGGEAVAPHTRAIELEPLHPRARFHRAQALLACQQPELALADFDAQLSRFPGHHESRSYRLFVLNYLDAFTREQLFDEHRSYGQKVEATEVRPPPSFPNQADPTRRLRIGFLSPDFRRHSVACFMEPLLRELDRAQFEVHLYHDHPAIDDVSHRFRAQADGWRHFAGQSADVVEGVIRRDQIDVLFDLAGHTGHNRLALFARRLAPVQISYLGYPNTTGLKAMDYRFTDEIADPPGGADTLHTERLVRFAPTAWTYEPPGDFPDFEGQPGVRDTDSTVAFGSFNALSKLSNSTLQLWSEVLRANPNSRLVLKSGGLEPARWLRRLAGHGISAQQVRLLPYCLTVAEHLACYAQIDVALDPFPYQGTTTTCEALWMGVPVVTLLGDRHASRVGASLLTAIGHPEWIARDSAEYLTIATRLAAETGGGGRDRKKLRDEFRASALRDGAGQATRFGVAVRSCWRTWCERG